MQRGFSVTELSLVLAIIALTVAAATPFMRRAVVRQQARVAVSQVESLVQRARMNAVKEKVSFRLVVHDENATPPNRLELQRDEGGSFATQQTYALPGDIRLLGSSMSDVTVSSQGICNSGSIYVQAPEIDYEQVSVKPTCLTEHL